MKRITFTLMLAVTAWTLAVGAQVLWTTIDLAGWNFWRALITP